MAEEEVINLILETKRKNEESMERITQYTDRINRRIQRILNNL
jgi:hypothetical protein